MDPETVSAFYARKNLTNSWFLGIRDVTNVNNERTAIAAILPAWGVLQPLNGISTPSAVESAMVLAAVNSLTLDFVARQRFSGRHLNVTTFSPASLPKANRRRRIYFKSRPRTHLHRPRSCALRPTTSATTAHLLSPGNPERRALLRRQNSSAYYAKLYGLTRDELRYILDPASIYGDDYPSETFRVLKNNETRQFGEYRTPPPGAGGDGIGLAGVST